MIENLTDEEMAALKATKNGDEWNDACERIKAKRGGQYPPDWYAKVLATQLLASIQASW